MGKLVSTIFVTLDGVYQAPGGPQEDTRGGFTHGGWSFRYGDEDFGRFDSLRLRILHELDLDFVRSSHRVCLVSGPDVNIWTRSGSGEEKEREERVQMMANLCLFQCQLETRLVGPSAMVPSLRGGGLVRSGHGHRLERCAGAVGDCYWGKRDCGNCDGGGSPPFAPSVKVKKEVPSCNLRHVRAPPWGWVPHMPMAGGQWALGNVSSALGSVLMGISELFLP